MKGRLSRVPQVRGANLGYPCTPKQRGVRLESEIESEWTASDREHEQKAASASVP